jgi:hypothetical protein
MFKSKPFQIVKTVNVETISGDSYFSLIIDPKRKTFHVEQPNTELSHRSTRTANETLLYESLLNQSYTPIYSLNGKLFNPQWETTQSSSQLTQLLLHKSQPVSVDFDQHGYRWFHTSGMFLRAAEENSQMFADGKIVEFFITQSHFRVIQKLIKDNS